MWRHCVHCEGGGKCVYCEGGGIVCTARNTIRIWLNISVLQGSHYVETYVLHPVLSPPRTSCLHPLSARIASTPSGPSHPAVHSTLHPRNTHDNCYSTNNVIRHDVGLRRFSPLEYYDHECSGNDDLRPWVLSGARKHFEWFDLPRVRHPHFHESRCMSLYNFAFLYWRR